MTTFPCYFLIFITDCQHTIIIPYKLLLCITFCNFFPFHYTLGLVNSSPSVFLCLYLILLIVFFLRFHSFLSLYFSLTLLLTSSFHHNVSLCLAGPFFYLQLLFVPSRKASFRTFQQTSAEASLLTNLFVLVYG